jgi:hypothetical protein
MAMSWEDEELLDLVEDHDLNVGILITVDKDNALSMTVRRRADLQSPAAEIMISRLAELLFRGSPTINKLPI